VAVREKRNVWEGKLRERGEKKGEEHAVVVRP